VPVVARGDQFVIARDLDIVAKFVGVQGDGHVPLPPHVLIDRWIHILRAGRRYVQQIPHERLNERAVDSRDRSVRVLSHHVFRIAEAFLISVVNGVPYTAELADLGPQPGTCATGEAVARYGDTVIERLCDWGATAAGESWQRTVQTFYGKQTLHGLLERSTWHAAQHARQLMYLLERFGVEPDGPLVDKDFEGLPLPGGLFE
jgi:hypothetical protein